MTCLRTKLKIQNFPMLDALLKIKLDVVAVTWYLTAATLARTATRQRSSMHGTATDNSRETRSSLSSGTRLRSLGRPGEQVELSYLQSRARPLEDCSVCLSAHEEIPLRG